MHMDNELFKGWVSINYLTDGEEGFWEYEKSGKVPVCGKGMTWLTLIPDDRFTIFLDMDGDVNLKNLVERTQAEVVAISDGHQNKVEEITHYLEMHPKVKRYVILSDFGTVYEKNAELGKHLVCVDASKGLQMENLMKVCEIMNMQ